MGCSCQLEGRQGGAAVRVGVSVPLSGCFSHSANSWNSFARCASDRDGAGGQGGSVARGAGRLAWAWAVGRRVMGFSGAGRGEQAANAASMQA
jgi:hypothetical protein